MMIWLAAVTMAVSAQAQMPPAQAKIAIVGADVLPMTSTERLRDQTVIIDGDHIVSVGPRTATSVPAGYRAIDARGKFVMPGLVDMHMHLSPEPGADWDSTQRALAISLANGVTTGRIMTGAPRHPEVRAKVQSGELAGPRLYLAAPAIADANTSSAEVAREKVRAAKAAGFDLIKAHAISDIAVWQAMTVEAETQGLPVAGHVTNSVGLQRALDAKQQIEHLDSVPAELMPPEAPRDFGQFLSKPELDVLDGVASTRFEEVARTAKAKNGFFVPTLAAFARIGEMERAFESMLSGPDDDYVAHWIIDDWRARRKGLQDAGFTLADSIGMRRVRRKITKSLHDAGVPLMAGSDSPHPFHIWGFGMIREIEALNEAGLSRWEALRSATVVPRDYFRALPRQGSATGIPADFGTVEAGARADLLILNADPLRDLGALRQIESVVAGGRLYDADRLKAMLVASASAAKKQPKPN